MFPVATDNTGDFDQDKKYNENNCNSDYNDNHLDYYNVSSEYIDDICTTFTIEVKLIMMILVWKYIWEIYDIFENDSRINEIVMNNDADKNNRNVLIRATITITMV